MSDASKCEKCRRRGRWEISAFKMPTVYACGIHLASVLAGLVSKRQMRMHEVRDRSFRYKRQVGERAMLTGEPTL